MSSIPTPAKAPAKKRHVHKMTYVGISRKETDFLMALSSEDVKTYLAFKWLADFSTGFVGTDPKRYVTLERLAESARTSTGKLIQQITNLQDIGLICELKKIDHVHVSFRLTLSPEIEDREIKPGELLNPVLAPTPPAAPESEIDDDGEVDSWADEYDGQEKFNPQYSSTSELSLSSTDSTDGGKFITITPVETSFLESIQQIGGSKPIEPPNPIDEIKLILNSHGFLCVHTPMSRTLYKQWLSFSNFAEIEAAAKQISELHETERTPLALDKRLRASKKPKSTGRGKVAL